MAQKSTSGDTRINVVVPSELKERLRRMAAGERKKISVLVREAIEEKIRELERKKFEETMREAYLEMARENVQAAEDFQYSDAENL